MAIQKIEVIDNNKVGDCDLLSVHNPLVYVVKMTLDDSGDPYDDVIEVDVNISGNETEALGTFYATFLRQDNPNERIYIFNADEVLRSGLNEYKDYEQEFNSKTISYDDVIDAYLAKGYYLTFRADASGTPIEITETLTGVAASRDFEYENGACLTEICDSEQKVYVGAKDKEVYTYDYFNDLHYYTIELPDTIVDGTVIQLLTYSSVDYMRRGYAITNANTGQELKFYLTYRATPSLSNEIQLGANIQESRDNLLTYCNANYTPSLSSFQILDSPTGATDKTLFFQDRTNWYIDEGLSICFFILNDFKVDSTPLHFDYTTPDGITTTQVRLEAKTTPTLATEFATNADSEILRGNIEAALLANYPSIAHIIIQGNILDPFFTYGAFQEPDERSSLGGFVVVGSTPAIKIDGVTPSAPLPIELNPVFLRKKIEVDSFNPFDVVMRSVTHVVYPKELCEGGYYIKYLDKNGQYRFMIGEKPSKQTRPKKIGDIDRIVTSLRTDLGSSQSVGERGNNIITVNFNNLRSDLKVLSGSEYVYLDEVALLEDLYNSPDVQLEIQEGKWIDVLISGGGTVRQSNKNSYSTSIRLSLPEKYNITKL